MDGKELNEFLRGLVTFMKEQGVSGFDLEHTDLKISLKFAGAEAANASAPAGGMDLQTMMRLMAAQNVAMAPSAAAPAVGPASPAPVAVPAASAPAATTHHVVKSPIVGTFYESPSPGASPFVKVGDQVEAGQVLCIVEAMKLMNEVESDMAGEIVERIAQVGQPVEYGQPLFSIKPR